MKATPENKIKAMVKDMLKRYPVFWYPAVAGPYSVSGIPDFVCCLQGGKFFTIETKAPGKTPTALQEKCMANIRQHGGKTFVVDGEESLLRLTQWIEEEL